MSISARRMQRSLVDTGGLPEGGYLTIIFSRVNWQALVASEPVPGKTKTLMDAANALRDHGLFGVGAVVMDRVHETERKIHAGFHSTASWNDMANLRDNYGWHFISQGKSYLNLTTAGLTNAEIREETGGSLAILEDHGHNNGWGLYCYPNDKQDARSQGIVNQYFAFGRKYRELGASDSFNIESELTVSPYILNTVSINGGRCNNPSLPCNTMVIKPADRLMNSPAAIAAHMSPPPGQWNVIQFYRFVDGKNGNIDDASAIKKWDTTSANWQNRWTGTGELFPWPSFTEALTLRTRRVTCVHPAQMAEMWGRIPPNPHG